MGAPVPKTEGQKIGRTINIGWFSTGRDPAARKLLTTVQDAIQDGTLPVRIGFVFSNREPGEAEESNRFFELVNGYGLPLITISSRHFWGMPVPTTPQDREAYSSRVIQGLADFSPDFCLLAGYMLIASPLLCRNFNMINLHPAAPDGPSGTWQEVTRQLIEQGAQATGAMMHLVTPELDQGPPVAYCRFPLRGKEFDPLWREMADMPAAQIRGSDGDNHPLFCLIRQEGLRREFPLILATIRLLAQGGVKIEGGRVVDRSGAAIPGYDLTGEVEEALTRSGNGS
ncbi:MAG: formyltransferase family protein [Dehalococcoidia bacterium]|jgi:folate-dependent phosphoribosylglycinamide formyltransferase PurN|nr:formyltransferase family protein [Dehalococcoidia bacterium]MDP7240441.1 formyltransferase family protein [Dehalococcoidia bacterium]MDP7470285.1 formyltransferase family protein [Dehalococcoidia bacterium]